MAMYDLIDRQDAIDLFLAKGMITAAIYMDRIPPIQLQQRWIPCCVRLPKKELNRYWVCTDTGYQCQCRWTNDVYGLGASDRWGWKIFDIPQYQKVVAWMPLPELWKGEYE